MTLRIPNTVPKDFDAQLFDALNAITEPPTSECCAKCRRGTKQISKHAPCGYDQACPNPHCAHAARRR